MKSKILYALAGALFSLSIVGFWGFKNKQEAESKYAVVTIEESGHEIIYAYESGNNSKENFEKKTDMAVINMKVIAKMDSEGYDLFSANSNLRISSGNTWFVNTIIFKKR